MSLNSANSLIKSKSGMVNRGITYLVTDTLLAVVIQLHFHYYLWVGFYCHSPLRRDTNLQIVLESYFLTTTSMNIFIVGYRMSLDNMLLCESTLIH